MPLLKRRAPTSFEVPLQDVVVRVSAPLELYEEARAAAMQVWEQIQSYGIRDREFRTSKRPLAVPEDAPEIVRRMAGIAGSVGVGPMFTLQGALTEHIGRLLAAHAPELAVTTGGDYFLVSRKRAKLPVHHQRDGEPMSIVIRPDLGPIGVYTTMGRLQTPADTADAVVVVADSCILADAVAAAVMAILRKPGAFGGALSFMRRFAGVHGGIVVQGERIGLTGAVEITP